LTKTDENAIKKANNDTITKIKEALEDKGIKFLSPKERGSLDGVGVRLFTVEEKR
jgi:hypothetical protein